MVLQYFPLQTYLFIRVSYTDSRNIFCIDEYRASRVWHSSYDMSLSEGGGRVLVVGLAGEEAHRLPDERVERFFRREVGGVAGDARPEQRRAVRRVVARHAAH